MLPGSEVSSHADCTDYGMSTDKYLVVGKLAAVSEASRGES